MTTTNNQTAATKIVHVYFVAIQYFSPAGIGFTNMEIPVHNPFTKLADVQEIEQYLRSKGYQSALVTGFTLLRTERVGASRGGRS